MIPGQISIVQLPDSKKDSVENIRLLFKIFFMWKVIGLKFGLLLFLLAGMFGGGNGFILAGDDVGNPSIRNYTPEEYQSQPQNWAIVQDQRGVIYVGNSGGILEFDGKNWSPLLEVPNRSRIRSLAIDQKGIIYVGAMGDFGCLAIDTNGKRSFMSFKNKLNKDDQEFNDVWKILATNRGIYFITMQKIFHWDHQKIHIIPANIYPGGCVVVYDHVFLIDKENWIWLLAQNRLELLPGLEKANKNLAIRSILPYGDRELLIATSKGEFYIYNLKMALENGAMARHNSLLSTPAPILEPFPAEIGEYLRENLNYQCTRLGDHQYAFATLKGGIVIMDDKGKLVQVINTNRGLQDNTAWNLFADDRQNLWAALNYGIAYIETGSPLTKFNQFNNLKGIVLSCIRHQGRLYVGNFEGIFYLPEYQMNIADDKHNFLPVKNANKGHCFDFLPSNHILLGLGLASVFQIIADEAILLKDTLRGPTCLGLSRRFPDHVFVGMIDGLVALKIKDFSNPISPPGNQQAIKEKLINNGGLANIKESIRKIVSDKQGNLWLTSQYNGILYLEFKGEDPLDFRISRYTTRHGLPGLISNVVHFIDNRLIVGTAKGIYRAVFPTGPDAKKEDIRFIPETTFGKFFAKKDITVSNICQDKHQKFWLDSAIGFGTVSPQADGSYQWDALPFKKMKGDIPGFFVEDNGIVWLCGGVSRCLWRFDSTMKKNYAVNYPALIHRVKAGSEGRLLFAGNYYDPASRQGDYFSKSSLQQPRELMVRLPYKDNSLSFEYSSTFYEQAEDNRFQYWLEGFDKDWSDWSDKSLKEYTNIPEGDYCFQVKARNVFEHESSPAAYRFSIAVPWQRTIFAYIGYVFLFVLVMFAGIRLNTRRLVAAKKKLEIIVEERTAELVVINQEITKQKDEIGKQRDEIETAYSDLYSTNRQLTEAKNALWGEMELAKKIQTVLLPDKPDIPGYEITAYMKPADEVGGDYYDVINIVGANNDSPRHWIVIGDVSGHGVPAGLVMMMAQTAIHTALVDSRETDPEKILRKINKIIYQNIIKMGENKYMTMTLLALQTDGAMYYSGLHQDIMIYRATQRDVELAETKGMWIGLMDDIEGMINVEKLVLEAGDVMLLYTDGLTEAVSQDDRLFSEERLIQVLKNQGGQSPEEIKNSIIDSLKNYTCKDDITFMILKKL
jgi:serine phosphatase RsbU (regulator of sigma subunit)